MKASNNNLPQSKQRNKNGKRRKRHIRSGVKNSWGQMMSILSRAKIAKSQKDRLAMSRTARTKAHTRKRKNLFTKIGEFFGSFNKNYSNKNQSRQMNIPRRVS